MGDAALDVVDVADEVEDNAELVVVTGLDVDVEVEMEREDEDDCVDEVDPEEVMAVELLIDLEEDDVTAAVEVVEVVGVLVDVDDARLVEIDDFEEEIADVVEVAGDDVTADDDTDVESTDQTLILQVPPQN